MLIALKFVIGILSVFTALGLLCAVRFAFRRDPGIGLRRDSQADPFSKPFGDVPGFSAEQLRLHAPPVCTRDPLRRSFAPKHFDDSAGLALQADADGGLPVFPSWFASISHFFRSHHHA